MTTRRTWIRRGVIVGLLALWITALGLWKAWRTARSQLSESRCDGHEQFIQSQWMDTTMTLGKLAVRGCMVDDLLEQNELRGMTRAAIVALIGEPPPADVFKEYDLVYWLGPERGLIGTDSEYLVIRLDRAGRATAVQLLTG